MAEEKLQDKTDDVPSAKSSKSTLVLVVISILLIGILISLAIVPSYLRSKQLETDKYNHFEFVKREDNFWYTVVNKGDQPYSVPFYYHPRELENIVVENNLRDKFFRLRENNGSIFITLDPDSTDNKIVIAGVEIARITGDRYGLLNVPTRSAFIKEPSKASANTETPIVTCDNSNNKTMVIWLAISNKNLVSSQGYCVLLEAKSYNETVMVADRLMYHLLGIMN